MDEDSPFQKKYLPDIHRMLPANPDAEQGVLASFLLAPREVGELCVENHVTPATFHIPGHASIFEVLMEMWQANQEIDFIKLTTALRKKGILDIVGGAAFVTSLFTFLPTAANVAWYLDCILSDDLSRRMIATFTEGAAKAYDTNDPVQLLDQMEAKVMSLRSADAKDSIVTANEAAIEAVASIQDAYERRGSITGLATGFEKLDELLDGLQPAQTYIIAARPSQGKTALAMNIAEFIAGTLKRPIGVFSLEMSTHQLMQRMLCSKAGVNLAKVRSGFLDDRDFPALTASAGHLAACLMYFDDTGGLSIQELRARARRMKSKYKIEALFVDYLQLLKSTSKKADSNRQIEVSEVSAGLKECAKELHIPIVVLAQISRDIERRGPDARPKLSDLKESGSIEQDADVVAFLNRPEMNAESVEEQQRLRGIADLVIAKSRNGPQGAVALTFIKEFTRFESRAFDQEYYEESAPEVQQQTWDL